MEKGDISNVSEPRQVFVWENLLATLSTHRVAAEARALKRKRWKSAFSQWDESDTMRHALHHLSWSKGQNVDILVTHEPSFAEVVREHLDSSGYSYGRFYNHTLAGFDAELAFLPEVRVVWHGESNRPFLFGSRGALLTNTGALFAHG